MAKKKKAATTGSRKRTRASASRKPSAKKAAATGAAPARKSNQRKPLAAGREIENKQVPIVGVGASAGGLEAFTQLLEALPSDTGMAFVLVPHLSHTHKSMLSNLLSKATQMPVTQVGRRSPVESNHVYVIPPNRRIAVTDGFLTTEALPEAVRPPMVIDSFFRSLAENRKSGAIGVVLSGTGTDGTLGLAAVKAEGGITFAQDEKSAKYSDMPRSASAAPGSADFVLPPESIAAELARIARHPYVKEAKPAAAEVKPSDKLENLFVLLRETTGVDFEHYKPATIKRRISRRMLLHKLDTLPKYLKRVRSDPAELSALYQDLLINVTGFFRDKATFETLEKEVIPEILKKRKRDEPVRVWVAGCATGEEAYSIAICLLEEMGGAGPSPPIQVFATDISAPAVQRAREGIYPENIAQDVSPDRLQRFFTKTDGGYQISKQVRDLCVFAAQNMIKDPPFSRMDLISCRNVLIYLDSMLQQRVLATFHYALKPGGFLVLGTSETAGTGGSGLFEQIDSKQKIYSKVQSAVRPEFDLGLAGPLAHRWGPVRKEEARTRVAPDIGKEADRIVLTRFAPPGVVVDSGMEILQFRGQTGPFLEPPPGPATLNLLRMAREGLVVDLRAALHQAKKTGVSVTKKDVRIRSDGGFRNVNLEVVPIPGETARDTCHLVLFHDVTPEEPAGDQAPSRQKRKRSREKQPASEREAASLREELTSTQEHLRSIIEEQEATNEELQSANEEILSSNEELQSTNEELETAKEELQATNEELTTVNEELQNRNVELAKVNNDLGNLIGSVDIVYVMVGNDLRIRRFTPAAQKALNLIAGDIKPNIDVPNLPDLITEVIETITHKEQEVRDSQGRWYSMRIRPYKTDDHKIEGAVLALVDIDALKRTQRALQESEAAWRRLVEEAPDFILSSRPQGTVLFINRRMADLAKEAVVGESIYDFLEPRDHETIRRCLEEVRSTAREASFKTRGLGRLRDAPRYVTRVEPVKTGGEVVAFTLVTKEMPTRKKTKKKAAAPSRARA